MFWCRFGGVGGVVSGVDDASSLSEEIGDGGSDGGLEFITKDSGGQWKKCFGRVIASRSVTSVACPETATLHGISSQALCARAAVTERPSR